ncbi:uncharacterized protein ARMOST_02892 [Armillaria ostoyae]|uniref:Uncharacterized protein n=1 Tax=Armillaria ostoyae TaxID=47428 RepID=A0A284QSW9_ARMOS|nr:uncharacterized protein ARMOST_02892 [Armillaria ostoyae]
MGLRYNLVDEARSEPRGIPVQHGKMTWQTLDRFQPPGTVMPRTCTKREQNEGVLMNDFLWNKTGISLIEVSSDQRVSNNGSKAEDARKTQHLSPWLAVLILVADIHTHPLSRDVGHAGGDPQSSRADMANAWARGVPGIVVLSQRSRLNRI